MSAPGTGGPLVLAIESSCDETGIALVEGGSRILSNVVASQVALHDPTGALTGLVRLGDLVKLRREAADGRLASVARPISEVPTARPDEALSSLIERIGAAIENRVLVFDQGRLVGIVSPVDVARLITVRQGSRP